MKIEKAIPIPPRHVHFNQKYPFRDMEVGESVALPAEAIHKARDAAYAYAKANKKKFTVRKISETEYRCWRVE
jgi:hypothetical protein